MKSLFIPHLKQSQWFIALGVELQNALLGAARLQPFKDQQAVYRQGDEPTGLYAVLDGQVRLISYTAGGSGFLMLEAESGDWFGEASTLDGEPRQQDAVGFGSGNLLHLSMGDIDRVTRKRPELWRAIGQLATQHQRAALEYIQWLISAGFEARIARLLLSRHARSSKGIIEISQEEIAMNVGASRQTVVSVLHRFRKAGTISLSYGAIRVNKAAILAGCL
ncbi:Crp/Fnr family transcriptional regulator [Bradyrhizobium sp. 14AA]